MPWRASMRTQYKSVGHTVNTQNRQRSAIHWHSTSAASAPELKRFIKRGKTSVGNSQGAVGAFNGLTLIHEHPEQIEADFLELLGLKPSDTHTSTQCVEPEFISDLAYQITAGVHRACELCRRYAASLPHRNR